MFWSRPEIAAIDCKDCFLHLYNLETGKPEMWRGQKARRPPHVPPSCHQCPKRGPDANVELVLQNIECIEHYLECSATGLFPDDPLVKRHAAILRQIEKRVGEQNSMDFSSLAAIQAMTATLRPAGKD